MKFLIDEDVPFKLIKMLESLSHDALRVKEASADIDIAGQSKKEGRILVTLDKDFTNRTLFPPKEYNIIHIAIHPPYANTVVEAIITLLENVPPNELKGLIVLHRSGPVRFSE